MKRKLISSRALLFLSPLLLTFILLTIWALLFSAYSLALIFFIFPLLLTPLNHLYFHIGKAILIIGTAVILTGAPYRPVNELNREIVRLAKVSPELSTKDKVEIYGLNILMGVSALPIYPEVGRETLMLCLPSPDNKTRRFKSDFMLHSDQIKHELEQLYLLLKKSGPEKKSFTEEKRVSWPASVYSQQFTSEARVALALNPCLLKIQAKKTENSCWLIELSCLVEIAYPEKSYVTLLKEPELKVEEGLFYQLQKAGWLHPYRAEWYHSFIKDFNQE